jgi:hypothetical protein
MCGLEFKSNAGLEIHIPQASITILLYSGPFNLTELSLQTHQQSQNLACIGCGDKFSRAAGLMQHIEKNECLVITQEMFERRRAEKAISKDAWASQISPDADHHIHVPRGHMSTFGGTDTSDHGGVSLLDENGPQNPPQQDFLAPSLKLLSLRDQYPTLQNLNPPRQKNGLVAENGVNLVPFNGNFLDDDPDIPSPTWSASHPAASTLFPYPQAPLRPIQPNSNLSSGPNTPNTPLSTDPNAHLITQPPPLSPAPILDPSNHYNDLTRKFECPGLKCGGSYTTIEAFTAHLTSSAHTGGRTVCPSCLAKFASTMALVAHCESPSKRCNIRNSANYNQILREITGGLIGAEGHHIDGSVRYVANDISKPVSW